MEIYIERGKLSVASTFSNNIAMVKIRMEKVFFKTENEENYANSSNHGISNVLSFPCLILTRNFNTHNIKLYNNVVSKKN